MTPIDILAEQIERLNDQLTEMREPYALRDETVAEYTRLVEEVCALVEERQ